MPYLSNSSFSSQTTEVVSRQEQKLALSRVLFIRQEIHLPELSQNLNVTPSSSSSTTTTTTEIADYLLTGEANQQTFLQSFLSSLRQLSVDCVIVSHPLPLLLRSYLFSHGLLCLDQLSYVQLQCLEQITQCTALYSVEPLLQTPEQYHHAVGTCSLQLEESGWINQPAETEQEHITTTDSYRQEEQRHHRQTNRMNSRQNLDNRPTKSYWLFIAPDMSRSTNAAHGPVSFVRSLPISVLSVHYTVQHALVFKKQFFNCLSRLINALSTDSSQENSSHEAKQLGISGGGGYTEMIILHEIEKAKLQKRQEIDLFRAKVQRVTPYEKFTLEQAINTLFEEIELMDLFAQVFRDYLVQLCGNIGMDELAATAQLKQTEENFGRMLSAGQVPPLTDAPLLKIQIIPETYASAICLDDALAKYHAIRHAFEFIQSIVSIDGIYSSVTSVPNQACLRWVIDPALSQQNASHNIATRATSNILTSSAGSSMVSSTIERSSRIEEIHRKSKITAGNPHAIIWI